MARRGVLKVAAFCRKGTFMLRTRWIFVLVTALVALAAGSIASACGGLFCANIPVDQQAERIIFTVNSDETVSAYVQVNYTGSAPDFSWVVPVPNVPEVDVAEIATFDEMSNLTQPVFVPPPMPECAQVVMPMAASAADSSVAVQEGQVQVLAQGTAGPYAYEVVTSDDPDALVVWLRENNYRVTPDMEPLIHVYNAEGQVFLAMKLQPDEGVQDIQPIKMTYAGTTPAIPLRLTAVAANPNMTIVTWVFANRQAYPLNWAHPTVDDQNLRGAFGSFGGTNYLQLVDQTVDLYGGRAFITEYAQPTSELASLGLVDPLVEQLARNYRYVTRLFGRVSPEEMTVDPGFGLGEDLHNVSNVHDLSRMNDKVFWGCDNTRPIDIQYDPAAVPDSFQ
jgi:hypothetical protein